MVFSAHRFLKVGYFITTLLTKISSDTPQAVDCLFYVHKSQTLSMSLKIIILRMFLLLEFFSKERFTDQYEPKINQYRHCGCPRTTL